MSSIGVGVSADKYSGPDTTQEQYDGRWSLATALDLVKDDPGTISAESSSSFANSHQRAHSPARRPPTRQGSDDPEVVGGCAQAKQRKGHQLTRLPRRTRLPQAVARAAVSGAQAATRQCQPTSLPLKPSITSVSRRVRQRHNVRHAFLSQTAAALNILHQGVALTSIPFKDQQCAASDRSLEFIAGRVKTFLDACRESGGEDIQPSSVFDFLPNFSQNEFLFSSPRQVSSGCASFSGVVTHKSSTSNDCGFSRLPSTSASASSTPPVQPFAQMPASPISTTSSSPISSAPTFKPLASDDVLFSQSPDFALAAAAYASAHNSSGQPAVAINADLISLPARAGVVSALKYAPPQLAAQLSNVRSMLRDPSCRSARSAPAAFLVREGHYPRLARKMFDIGMVHFSEFEPDVVCGAFAVPKSDGSQRLIIDARRANVVFQDPPRVFLPTPDILSSLEASGPVRSATADRSDYYHSILLPEPFWSLFGLPAVSPAEIGLEHVFPGVDRVWPCIKTLPMGWSWAVAVGQELHLEFIRQRVPLLPSSALVSPAADLRLDRLRFSVYIDDLTIVGPDADEVNRALDQYIQESAAEQMLVKSSKVFRAASRADITGLHFDGDRGALGVAPSKLLDLCRRTMAVIRAPVAAEAEVSSILGAWTWAMLPRRPSLSAFGTIYKWIQRFDGGVAPLWPSARLELAVACALAPLMFADLVAPWFERTVATDASSVAQGVVATVLQPGARIGLAAGAGLAPRDALATDDIFDNCLQRTIARQTALGIDTAAVINQSMSDFISNSHWTTVVSSRWRRAEHINVHEATALRTAVSWVRSHASAVNKRLLVLSDSAVVVLSTAKGRSSSKSLLFQCRRTNALLLSSVFVCIVAGYRRISIRLTMPRDLSRFFLLYAKAREKTVKDYRTAVQLFLSWCDDNSIPSGSNADLDFAFTEYIHDMYEQHGGACRSTVARAL